MSGSTFRQTPTLVGTFLGWGGGSASKKPPPPRNIRCRTGRSTSRSGSLGSAKLPNLRGNFRVGPETWSARAGSPPARTCGRLNMHINAAAARARLPRRSRARRREPGRLVFHKSAANVREDVFVCCPKSNMAANRSTPASIKASERTTNPPPLHMFTGCFLRFSGWSRDSGWSVLPFLPSGLLPQMRRRWHAIPPFLICFSGYYAV